jgi:magnesium transporter
MRVEAIKIEGEKPASLTGLNAQDVFQLVNSEDFTWIDIQITDDRAADLGQLLVDRLDFHPATVSDCFSRDGMHQPKLDEEQDYRFITFIYYEQKSAGKLTTREMHAYIGENYVITVHRHDCEPLLAQIRQFPRVITDYEQRAILFAHHVLDMIVDTFTAVLRDFSRRSDELEISVLKVKKRKRARRALFKRPVDQMADMRGLLRLRRSLVRMRRSLAEEEEIIDTLVDEFDHEHAPESSKEIAIYFRDISDHIGKYLETIEALDSTFNHLMEVHSLITSHRTNEIIYLLTIVSAIMLPLNLIVGFFGMNFDNLWFAHHSWGIWAVTMIMFSIILGLFVFFRYKEWI